MIFDSESFPASRAVVELQDLEELDGIRAHFEGNAWFDILAIIMHMNFELQLGALSN